MTVANRFQNLQELILALGYGLVQVRGSLPAEGIPLRSRLQTMGALLMSEEVYPQRLSLRCTDPKDHLTLIVLLQGRISVATSHGSIAIRHLEANHGNVVAFYGRDQDLTITQVPCRLLRVMLPLGAELDGACVDLGAGPMHCFADLGLLPTMLLLLEQSVARGPSEQIRADLFNTLFAYLWDRLAVAGCAVTLPPQQPIPITDPLERLEVWLASHLSESLVLADLASAVCLSPRRLQELYRRHYGFSPMDHLRRLRLAALASLLVDPNSDHLTISGLMKCLQLSDNHVTRLSFRRLYGITPSEFRQKRTRVDSHTHEQPLAASFA